MKKECENLFPERAEFDVGVKQVSTICLPCKQHDHFHCLQVMTLVESNVRCICKCNQERK